MKTKIIFNDRSAEKITVCKDFENEVKKSIFLALKDKGLLTQKQCEECLKRIV